MSPSDFLIWVKSAPIPAFFLGVFLLAALGTLCSVLNKIVKHIVNAIRGLPPEVLVSCPYRCQKEHCEDHQDEEDDE